MSVLQKMRDFYDNVFEYYPVGYIEGGDYFFTRSSNAGIIRVQVLFEGGSYLRKYYVKKDSTYHMFKMGAGNWT